MSLTTVTSWAQLVATLIAILALITAAYYSRRSIYMAKLTLDESSRNAQEALLLSVKQAFDYQGGQSCVAYRDQVLRLYELGCTAEQIKYWFRQEEASEHPDAYDAFEAGCGSVEELVSILPRLSKMQQTTVSQPPPPTR